MIHPLSPLSVEETDIARKVVLAAHPDHAINFRVIYLKEPQKGLLQEYLAKEHAAELTSISAGPPRLAFCQYDVISVKKQPQYHESIVDLGLKSQVQDDIVDAQYHASLTL